MIMMSMTRPCDIPVTSEIIGEKRGYKGNNDRGKGKNRTCGKPLASFNSWQPLQTVFMAVAFDQVNIWGDYHNQLSVRVPELKEIEN